jgi:hypothetical protein
MSTYLPEVRRQIIRWVTEIPIRAANKDIPIEITRIRIVPFTSGSAQPAATDFFVPGIMEGRLRGRALNTIRSLEKQIEDATSVAATSPGLPQALDALQRAMHSDWSRLKGKCRHVIVLLTDTAADVSTSAGWSRPASSQTPLDHVTDLWEEGVNISMRRGSSFLVLLAPDVAPWNAIGDAWTRTVFLPSKAGDGLSEVEYDTILEVIVNSWI